ncbi:GspH/FimT family pseudopilin [Lysobacter koreensis]|uniref:Type II secretion system protein H n=1 Tax=Lysobacter koreensis TaxID=266122 RepID=A0ABW2YSA2_9GAMM
MLAARPTPETARLSMADDRPSTPGLNWMGHRLGWSLHRGERLSMTSKGCVTGFTLIELMVTISVLAILLAIALPSFQGTLRSNRVATTTNELLAAISLARTEAIRNTRGAAVCPSTAGTACDGTWNQGWLVWSDINSDGLMGAGETPIKVGRVDNRLQVAAPAANVLRFDTRGRLHPALGGAQQIGLQSAQCPSGDPLVRTLTVTPTGQVNIVKGNCP